MVQPKIFIEGTWCNQRYLLKEHGATRGQRVRGLEKKGIGNKHVATRTNIVMIDVSIIAQSLSL